MLRCLCQASGVGVEAARQQVHVSWHALCTAQARPSASCLAQRHSGRRPGRWRAPMHSQEAAECRQSGPSPLPAFYRWVDAQQAAGRLRFAVRGEAEALDWEQDAVEALAWAPAGAPVPAAAVPAAAPATAVALVADEDDADCEPVAAVAAASQRR